MKLGAIILTSLLFLCANLQASIIVAHDVNTFSSSLASNGSQEVNFAVNVANFLTQGRTKSLLLFESNSDTARNYSAPVLTALQNAGFSVTVTQDFSTSMTGFGAIFAAKHFNTNTFVNNNDLISYAQAGGGVYLAGGVGSSASLEASGWGTFLNHFGLAYTTSFNPFSNVTITSDHEIFDGISNLRSGSGNSILDLNTNPNAEIVQLQSGQGVYAIVTDSAIPEPTSISLLLIALTWGFFQRRNKS